MYKQLFRISLLLIALISAHKGYHREGEKHQEGDKPQEGNKPQEGEKHQEGDKHREGEKHREGKGHDEEKCQDKLRKHCVFTNSIGQTFNLAALRVNHTNGYYNVDNVLNFALCGKLHQEECHSKKICYHRNGECINTGDSKQWVDIASNDTLFFDYVGGDACNNGKWLTSFEIRYDVTAGSFDIQEIVYSVLHNHQSHKFQNFRQGNYLQRERLGSMEKTFRRKKQLFLLDEHWNECCFDSLLFGVLLLHGEKMPKTMPIKMPTTMSMEM